MRHTKVIIAAILFYIVSCSSAPETKEKSLVAADTQRMDSRGCMISPNTSVSPAKGKGVSSAAAAETYYEKLEYYFLLAAENCISSKDRCDAFETVLSGMETRLYPASAATHSGSPSDQASLERTIKHSNNKMIAMIAINMHFIEKQQKKTLPPLSWLKRELKANDLTAVPEEMSVTADKKKFPFSAHNMAAASARAHMFVGVLNKDKNLMEKGLSQIPHILQSARPDGSLPLETRRGSRALRYSMQVLSDILAMIDVSPDKANIYSKYKKQILSLAEFDMLALKNTTLLETYAQDNLAAGPIQDYKLQDISSLRSRLAWVLVLNSLEPGYLDSVEDIEIDKKSCSHTHLKKKPECSPLLNSVGDVISSPLGFTLGYNPKCVAVL